MYECLDSGERFSESCIFLDERLPGGINVYHRSTEEIPA